MGTAKSVSKNDLIHQLHVLVNDVLVEAGDPNYTEEEQNRLNRQAKAIRDRRMRLRRLSFDQATEGYVDAIDGIEKVTAAMDEAVDKINDLVDFFGKTAQLVASLDRLIAAARP